MSDELFRAMREYIRSAVELEVLKRTVAMRDELAKEIPKEGPPGPKGEPGLVSVEEMESAIDKRIADIAVKTLADAYQGVYKPATAYVRGMLVTWGGCLWLSLADTQRKPGETTDWRLVVKK